MTTIANAPENMTAEQLAQVAREERMAAYETQLARFERPRTFDSGYPYTPAMLAEIEARAIRFAE
jgi:hypothetical protein